MNNSKFLYWNKGLAKIYQNEMLKRGKVIYPKEIKQHQLFLWNSPTFLFKNEVNRAIFEPGGSEIVQVPLVALGGDINSSTTIDVIIDNSNVVNNSQGIEDYSSSNANIVSMGFYSDSNFMEGDVNKNRFILVSENELDLTEEGDLVGVVKNSLYLVTTYRAERNLDGSFSHCYFELRIIDTFLPQTTANKRVIFTKTIPEIENVKFIEIEFEGMNFINDIKAFNNIGANFPIRTNYDGEWETALLKPDKSNLDTYKTNINEFHFQYAIPRVRATTVDWELPWTMELRILDQFTKSFQFQRENGNSQRSIIMTNSSFNKTDKMNNKSINVINKEKHEWFAYRFPNGEKSSEAWKDFYYFATNVVDYRVYKPQDSEYTGWVFGGGQNDAYFWTHYTQVVNNYGRSDVSEQLKDHVVEGTLVNGMSCHNTSTIRFSQAGTNAIESAAPWKTNKTLYLWDVCLTSKQDAVNGDESLSWLTGRNVFNLDGTKQKGFTGPLPSYYTLNQEWVNNENIEINFQYQKDKLQLLNGPVDINGITWAGKFPSPLQNTETPENILPSEWQQAYNDYLVLSPLMPHEFLSRDASEVVLSSGTNRREHLHTTIGIIGRTWTSSAFEVRNFLTNRALNNWFTRKSEIDNGLTNRNNIPKTLKIEFQDTIDFLSRLELSIFGGYNFTIKFYDANNKLIGVNPVKIPAPNRVGDGRTSKLIITFGINP